jgi:nucleotide-binding universal stress UspA family protein
MFKRIMLAADGSEHSLRAADKAAMIASYDDESYVSVVYVVDSDESRHEILESWETSDISSKRRAKLQPIEDALRQAGARFGTILLEGKPGPTIVDYANKHGFDLVIIGSRGLNSLQEFVLGSVSHKVAKRVECPVLIVK